MKVAIAGAGNVGVYIAGDLRDAGHEVMLIEQDPDLVARLRSTLNVQWFIADACEVSSLHEAGLETVLVLSGSTHAADVARFPFRPSRICDSIADVIELV